MGLAAVDRPAVFMVDINISYHYPASTRLRYQRFETALRTNLESGPRFAKVWLLINPPEKTSNNNAYKAVIETPSKLCSGQNNDKFGITLSAECPLGKKT